MRARLARAVVAVVLLLAFVGDLRVVAPILTVVLALAAWRDVVPGLHAIGAAIALAVATLSFELDNEIVAWSIVLTVAALAGLSVAIVSGRAASYNP
jgi:hypothetical protein